MNAGIRTLALAVLGAGALVSPASGGDAEWAPRPDAGVKDWYQRRGNAGRTGLSTFEPIRTQPEVAWRVKIDGSVTSNVVTWNGVVYVGVTSRKGGELRAFSVEDGSKLGLRRLPGRPLELAVWNGTVAVRHDEGIWFLGHKNRSFRLPVKWEGTFAGGPLIHDGICHARTSYGLERRKVGSRTSMDDGGRCDGTASIQLVRGRPVPVHGWLTGKSGYVGEYLHIKGIGEMGPAVRRRGSDPPFTVHRLERGGKGGWLVTGDMTVLSTEGAERGVFYRDGESGFHIFDIRSEVIVRDGRAFGWNGDGELVQASPAGVRTLITRESKPPGFEGRRLSAARDVLYVGNTAVDADSGRVLWCMEGLSAASPLIPAGDGRIAVVTESSELIGLAAAGTPTSQGASAEGTTASSSSVQRSAPPDEDGVLLANGEFIAGKVEPAEGGGVHVTAAGGAPRRVQRGEYAAATSTGKLVGDADEFLAYRVWRDVLHAEFAEVLAGFFKRCVRERFLQDARRVLERARDFGLAASRVDELGSRVTGLSENPNSKKKRPRLLREEQALNGRLERRVIDGAEWLSQRGLDRAAAALLAEASTLSGADGEWAKRALVMIPEEFPLSKGLDAGARWARWARALLPSGARFLPRSAREFKFHDRKPWNEGCVGLATANLRMLSRSTDPDVVGGCLQRGEAAVRALEQMLYDKPPTERGAPLVVLLHKNNKEYLAERAPGGGAPTWSAGYYSPSENVSRFFVPSAEGSRDPLGRGLYSTLAHELTHHWVGSRWVGSRGSTARTPGYWVVEGIATFVGDQAADSDPYTVRLDDIRIPSLDAMAQAAAAGKSIPLTNFVDLPQLGFARLGDTEIVTVQLRNTLGRRAIDERSLFYEQAAALTWFMMNRRGATGREHLRRYLWAHYKGRSPKGGWKSLGFDSPAQFAGEFGKFLSEVAGKPLSLAVGARIAGGPKLPAATPGGARRPPPTQPPPTQREGPLEIGDAVWIPYGGKHRAGRITGEKDGKVWVKFGYLGRAKKALVERLWSIQRR